MRLLPDARKSGDLHFFILKSLSYNTRILLASSLIAFGFLVEIFANFWIGLIIIAIGNSISFIKGFKPKSYMRGTVGWNQVTPDEFDKVVKKNNEIKHWDSDLFDFTNPHGAALFFIILVPAGLFFFFFKDTHLARYAWYLIANVIVILLPHWLFGTREYLKKDALIIKIKALKRIINLLEAPSYVQVLPMLAVKKSEKGEMPTDARLMARLVNAPDHFLGMQIQVSINDVQGKSYPYLYCVLIAREGHNYFKDINDSLIEKISDEIPTNLVMSKKKENDVDVLVIRQKTTKKSGYHTNKKHAKAVVLGTLQIARKLLES